MKIRLHDLPAEGLPISGTFDRDILDLDPKDTIQPNGRVEYDLLVEVDDDTLILTGKVKAPVLLRCVSCLDDFPFTLQLDDYFSDFDGEEDLEHADTVDLAQLLREDILLAMPGYPHCNEGDDPGRVCPRAGTLHFESPAPDSGRDGEREGGPGGKLQNGSASSQWSALDQLGKNPDESDESDR